MECIATLGLAAQLTEFRAENTHDMPDFMGRRIAVHRLGASQDRMTDPQFPHTSFLSAILWRRARRFIVLALLGGTAVAQAVSVATLSDGPLKPSPVNPASVNRPPISPGSTAPGAAAWPIAATALPEAPSHDRFWDNENRALFAMVAALSAADFALTRSILQNGGKELNPVTRLFSGSTAGLAVNFAGETAGIIGLSYYFHKTGHHQLERIAPMLNIAASSFAVVYDFNHR